jgi:ribosomal protein S18 acetylase RimI-like enzyme
MPLEPEKNNDQVSVRPATAADATVIGQLSAQFADYLRSLGDPTDFQFTAEVYLRDGFGPDPAFAGIVAEAGGEVIGYLLYHFGYDIDRAIRLLHVIDLYVREDSRRRGAGFALMNEAARICRDRGGRELFWAVYIPNTLAARFYERLGAYYVEDLHFMAWRV